MVVRVNFTSVAYSVGNMFSVEHIFGDHPTQEQIDNAIPKGAAVEQVVDINANFEVDGNKLLGWLLENGELK